MIGAGRIRLVELIERLYDDPRLRQRAAALGAVSLFFAGALVVIGLGEVVLVVMVLAIAAGVLFPVARRLRRDDLRRVADALASETARGRGAALLRRTQAVARAAGESVERARRQREAAHQSAIAQPTEEELYGWPYAGSPEIASAPRPSAGSVDAPRRTAVELNARGTHLRRAGDPAAAVAVHLEALELLRSLDDRRAQALTLNSLALALAANGETDPAVERFEESLSILRDHPDDPGEAEVIANLGFTLLRAGGEERARALLAEALDKLPPDSRAAHKVEAQLRRAS